MPDVLEIDNVEQLALQRPWWNRLLSQTPNATFFHTLDWLEVYWRHFGHDQKLRVLVVLSDGEPTGIVPLAVRREPTRVGRVSVLGYPLSDWGSFFGPIGPEPMATLAAGLSHVRQSRRDWDLLDLRYIDAAGTDRGCTPRAMRMAGFSPQKQTWARVALIDLAGTWEEYWQSRPSKWRSNVGRCRRRLSELGRVTYLRYRPRGDAYGDGDPRWDLYDASVHLAQDSWQGSSSTGTTLSHTSVQPFLRDAHGVAAALGNLDLNLLMVDDRPAAFSYNYQRDGWISGLRMGFDPTLAAYGPGTVLQAMIVEDSFCRGDRVYDLGVGSLECKQRWQTGVVASHRYTHFPLADLRADLLRAKRWFQNRFYGSEYAQYEVKP